MKQILIILISLTSFGAMALDLGLPSVNDVLSGSLTTRYRNEPGRNRAQQKVVLKFKAKLDSGIELVAVGGNRTSFNSSYDTFYDSSKDDEFDGGENIYKNFGVKNLYIQKTFESELVIQAGALSPEKGQKSTTALDSGGWVDGVRLKKDTSIGKVTVTAGSLTDPDETNAFERDHDLNYFEVTLNKEIFDNIVAEVGYEHHDGDNFIVLTHKHKVAIASDKLITIVGEALINVDESAIKASAGIKGDFIQLLTNRKTGITFEVRTNYTGDDIGDRGTEYTSGFKTSKGHYGTVEAKFNINKKHKVTGYCRYRKNYDEDINDERFECGATKKY